MTRLYKRLLEHAKVELIATAATNKKQNVVAILFDKHAKTLVFGFNSFVKTSPIQADLAKRAHEPDKMFLHAEISAICRWNRLTNVKPYGILIARMGKVDNQLILAAPCSVCQLALKEFGIRKIYHT